MKPRPDPQMLELPAVTPRDWFRCDLAELMGPLAGRRLILVNADGSHHDFRCWIEPVLDGGVLILWAVSDEDWWRHQERGVRPRLIRWPAAAAWVESPP